MTTTIDNMVRRQSEYAGNYKTHVSDTIHFRVSKEDHRLIRDFANAHCAGNITAAMRIFIHSYFKWLNEAETGI